MSRPVNNLASSAIPDGELFVPEIVDGGIGVDQDEKLAVWVFDRASLEPLG
jgi:hypothetical protein